VRSGALHHWASPDCLAKREQALFGDPQFCCHAVWGARRFAKRRQDCSSAGSATGVARNYYSEDSMPPPSAHALLVDVATN